MRETARCVIAILLLSTIGFVGCASGPPQRVVDDNLRAAQDTFTAVQADSADAGFQESLKKAKAILIVTPGVDRAVALARSNSGQGWSAPAFYNVTMLGTSGRAGGMGFSRVPHNLKLVVLAMSDRAVEGFIKPRLPGTDTLVVYTAAATVVGGSRRVAENAADADLLVFTTRQGADALTKSTAQFGSPIVSIEAAANRSFYGRAVTPADILVEQSVSNPSAAPLQQVIAAGQ